MKIINLTPHDVVITTENGVETIKRGKEILRVSTKSVDTGIRIKDITVTTTEFELVGKIPKYQAGIYYIVSSKVKRFLPNRFDLLVPEYVTRDNNGTPLQCKSLSV